MADFDVVVASGATVVDWLDPAQGSTPSRLNSRADQLQKRWLGKLGVAVVLKARVGTSLAPLDASLGGRLFAAYTVEAPPPALPFASYVSPEGQSSLILLTMVFPGHYTIGVRRPYGGFMHVHLDIG